MTGDAAGARGAAPARGASRAYLSAPGGGEGLSPPLREEVLRILGDETDLLSAALNRLSDPRWGEVRPPDDPASAISLLAADGILTAVLGAAGPSLLPALSEEIKTRLALLKFAPEAADDTEQEGSDGQRPSERARATGMSRDAPRPDESARKADEEGTRMEVPSKRGTTPS